MARDERLQERIEEMRDEARERLGGPPTPEEILAYLDDRLAAAERLRVEEGVAAFPEAARLLRDLARFPHLRPDPGVEVPSEAELDARWRAFRRRRGARPDGRVQPGGSEPVAAGGPSEPSRPPGLRPARRPKDRTDLAGGRPATGMGPARRGVVHRLLVAALIVVSAGLGLVAGLLLAPEEGRINLALASLAPEGESGTRGAETVLRIPRSAEGVLLSLGYAGAASGIDYSLTIRTADGETVWNRGGLRPAASGSFLVVLPAGLLDSGSYRLELAVPGEPETAAVYALKVAAG